MDLGLRCEQSADLRAPPLRCPAQGSLQNLAHVHALRNAQRIEHHVDRRAVIHVGHILDRPGLGTDSLVAVAAGHLFAGLPAAPPPALTPSRFPPPPGAVPVWRARRSFRQKGGYLDPAPWTTLGGDRKGKRGWGGAAGMVVA